MDENGGLRDEAASVVVAPAFPSTTAQAPGRSGHAPSRRKGGGWAQKAREYEGVKDVCQRGDRSRLSRCRSAANAAAAGSPPPPPTRRPSAAAAPRKCRSN